MLSVQPNGVQNNSVQPFLPALSFGRRQHPESALSPLTQDVFVKFGAKKADKPTDIEKQLMQRAIEISAQSKDPSSKVGVVIADDAGNVLSEDYNHFPPGIDDNMEIRPERWERPLKYDYIGHGERNAIFEAAKKGVALDGSRIVLNWYPCINCAQAIISTGIKELVAVTPDFEHERWGKDFQFVDALLKEAGIKQRLFAAEDFETTK